MEVDPYWQGKRRVKGGRGGGREQHGCILRIQKQGGKPNMVRLAGPANKGNVGGAIGKQHEAVRNTLEAHISGCMPGETLRIVTLYPRPHPCSAAYTLTA